MPTPRWGGIGVAVAGAILTLTAGGCSKRSAAGACAEAPAIHGDLRPVWALALGAGTAGRAVTTPAGQVVVTGTFADVLHVGGSAFPGAGPNNAFLLALDGDGHVLWERTFPTNWTPADLGVDAAGDLFVVGNVGPFAAPADLGMGPIAGPLVIARLDSGGNTIWSRGGDGIVGDATQPGYASLGVSAAGDLALAGNAYDQLTEVNFVARLDSSGTLAWSKPVATSLQQPRAAFDAGGDVVIAGDFAGTIALGAPLVALRPVGFLASLDATGNVLSARVLAAGSSVTAMATSGGRALLAGVFAAPLSVDGASLAPRGAQDLLLASLDVSNGATPAAPVLSTFPAVRDSFDALAPEATGGVVVLGQVNDFLDLGAGLLRPTALLVARFDPAGALVASAAFDAPFGARGSSISVDAAGGLIAFGTFDRAIDLGTGVLAGASSPPGDTLFVARYLPDAPDPAAAGAPCPPLVGGALLATPQLPQPPENLILRGDTVYFSTDSEVMSLPIGVAGAQPTVLAHAQSHVVGLAADDQALYWVNAGVDPTFGLGPSGSIVSMPLAGGDVTVLASAQDAPSALAIDDAQVYWTEGGRLSADGMTAGPPDGELRVIAKTGGTPAPLASGLSFPGPVATGGGFVIFASQVADPTSTTTTPMSQIVRIDPASGAALPLAATDRGVNSLVTDAATVFWTDANSPTVDVSTDDGRLRSVPLAGGAAAVLRQPLLGPGLLALGADRLYWAEQGSFFNARQTKPAAVWWMPKAGGVPTTAIGGLEGLDALAVDDSRVAWVEVVDENGTWALRVQPR